MKNTTLNIQEKTGRINRIFGGRYKGSIIYDYSYLVNVYKYIYLNPVVAGISSKAEFYPYSSLYYKYTDIRHLSFRLKKILPKHAFYDFDDLDELKWINLGYNDDEYKSIQTGIKKTVFSFAKDQGSGKEVRPVVRAKKKKTQEELWSELLEEDNKIKEIGPIFLGSA